ncbi:hypothetical protein HR45_13985 [Shewanella mangrovi]|uniref:Flagella biosynthesis chaperone for FliD, FliT n=1 Tax=Shewanella mangrovi TaxID=1515746 RepID=A0A094JWW6_9GAMM|nr:hypothetical protein [Shewanella mangrovi]KFZ36906.1 hypothetical protein HR45_13985 [Shewanella mangrovi]
MTTVVTELEQKNADIDALLDVLVTLPFEDEQSDILVSKLQELINDRQKMLSQFIAVEKNAESLKEQLEVTRRLELKASEIRQHRRDLMLTKSRKSRQLNVYKSVDSNR